MNGLKPSISLRAKPVIEFTVSEPAFLWLKALMQNPVYEDESEEEKNFRCEFFDAMMKIDLTRLMQSFHTLDDIPF